MQKNPVLPEWFTKLIDKFLLNQSWLTINVNDASQLSELSQDQIAFFMNMVKLMQTDLPESQLVDEVLSLGPREVEEKVTAIDIVLSRSQRVGLQISTINQQVNQQPTQYIQQQVVHIGTQQNFFGMTGCSENVQTMLVNKQPLNSDFQSRSSLKSPTGKFVPHSSNCNTKEFGKDTINNYRQDPSRPYKSFNMYIRETGIHLNVDYDLSGAQFEGLDFSFTDFSNRDLQRTNFRDSIIYGANLEGTRVLDSLFLKPKQLATARFKFLTPTTHPKVKKKQEKTLFLKCMFFEYQSLYKKLDDDPNAREQFAALLSNKKFDRFFKYLSTLRKAISLQSELSFHDETCCINKKDIKL
ncbi:MAG: pentapeptide repeat-containing protein [Gammaproteobacteria bacterium]|nr:pentapeptide repeat-containing protein [Gammaproteobacteria bacterium]